MRQRRRNRLAHDGEDDDPMSVVSNLFDVAMVFALALMVALVSRYNMTEMFSKDNFTMDNRLISPDNASPHTMKNATGVPPDRLCSYVSRA